MTVSKRSSVTRGGIYSRFSTEFQHSTADQVRSCREWADLNDVEVVRVFSDEGVTGKSSKRSGLTALLTALENDEIDVVIIFTTNRLYRKMYKSLQFVEEEIVERGKRCVFTHSGIDTRDSDDWRLRLQLTSAVDEFVISTAAKHINAAHEGLLLQRRVYGTIAFGYRGDPIEGSVGRRGSPQKQLVIDATQSLWVKRIFELFVERQRNLTDIARLLKNEGAPLPPRPGKKGWTRGAVKGVLINVRYLGEWAYGRTKATWLNKKNYVKQELREVPLKVEQFEELRIIDDLTFARAQARLADLGGSGGRPPKDGIRSTRPKVLNKLLFCAKHTDQVLHAGGSNGKHMICPVCKSESDPYLYSVLPRRLTLELVCERLAELVLQDGNLVSHVVTACQQQIESADRPSLEEVRAIEHQLAKKNEQIKFVWENLGDTEADRAESRAYLRTVRREREELQVRLAELQHRMDGRVNVPNRDELQAACNRLGEILINAASSENLDDSAAAYKLIRVMTGGKIIVSQVGERRRKQGHLRLNFIIDRFAPLGELTGGSSVAESIPIEIDVVPKDSTDDDLRQLEPLFDAGLLLKDIAKQTGHYYSYVRKLWQVHCERRGIPVDGRKRRAQLSRKQSTATVHESIAQQAIEMTENGASVLAIAKACNVSWPTANRALRKRRGDHGSFRDAQRKQQQALQDQIVELFEQGTLLNEIAAEVKRAPSSVRNALRTWFNSHGKAMPDLRGRRHSIAAQRAHTGAGVPSPADPEEDGERRAG